jgi:antitoxin YefM
MAVIALYLRKNIVIKAIQQKGIVGKEGKMETHATELEEGTNVDIIILVSDTEPDTTAYLLSTEANQRELSEALERIENKEDLVIITAKEWHEKYSIRSKSLYTIQ